MMNKKPVSILCIDDDSQIRFALKAVFDTQGWISHMAEKVCIGLNIFRKNQIDLVLIDYHLPGTNGIDGVKLLRKLSWYVPIVVLTVEEKQSVADEFLNAGASDFAVKPISAPDIVSRINLHIRLMEKGRRSDQEQTKGITSTTLDLIMDFMQEYNKQVTVETIANGTGLANQTVYRYLQHLHSQDNLEIISQYGRVGRPKQYYRLL